MKILRILCVMLCVLLSVSVGATSLILDYEFCEKDTPLLWRGKCYSCDEERTLEHYYPDRYDTKNDILCEEICSNRILYGFSWLDGGEHYCAKDTLSSRFSAMMWNNAILIILPPLWFLYFICAVAVYKFLYAIGFKIQKKSLRKGLSIIGLFLTIVFWGYYDKGNNLIGGFLITSLIMWILKKIFFKDPKKEKKKIQENEISKSNKIIQRVFGIVILGFFLYVIIMQIIATVISK